ncbi:MAG TPA: hypothetical protein VH044_03125 [Polyangiaceae bacterium]|nr:hypothetical protein [Polyangiaceae bacterium]
MTREAPDGAIPEASAPVTPLFQGVYPQNHSQPVPDQSFFARQCLENLLPLGEGAMPNCVVVSARMLPDASEQELADCERCDAPGLEPFDGSAPLESVGEGLSSYRCVCAVSSAPRGLPCPAQDGSSASWCYATIVGNGPPLCAPPFSSGAYLGFSGPALTSGTLFVACFEPPVFL